MLDLNDIAPSDSLIESAQIVKYLGLPKGRILLRPPYASRLIKSKLGIDKKKFLDWRALEARWHQLETVSQTKHQDAMTLLRSFVTPRHRIVYVALKDGFLVYDADSRTYHKDSDVVSSYVAGKNRDDKFITVPYEPQGKTLENLMMRGDIYQRAARSYKLVFQASIESRLDAFLKQCSGKYTSDYWYVETKFILQNDDRKYVVTNKGHKFTWIEGDTYEVV